MAQAEDSRINASELTVKTLLGEGGFAHVFRAHYAGRAVALKVLTPAADNAASDEYLTAKELFLREGRALLSIEHPHIIQCYALGPLPVGAVPGLQDRRGAKTGGPAAKGATSGSPAAALAPAMCLEMCEPYTPRQLIMRGMASASKTYTNLQALEWLEQIASALAHLHSRKPMLIHRDVKCENILLKKGEDGRLVAKLADLGLCVEVEPDRSAMLRRKSSRALLTPGGGGGHFSRQSSVIGTPQKRTSVHAAADGGAAGVALSALSFGGMARGGSDSPFLTVSPGHSVCVSRAASRTVSRTPSVAALGAGIPIATHRTSSVGGFDRRQPSSGNGSVAAAAAAGTAVAAGGPALSGGSLLGPAGRSGGAAAGVYVAQRSNLRLSAVSSSRGVGSTASLSGSGRAAGRILAAGLAAGLPPLPPVASGASRTASVADDSAVTRLMSDTAAASLLLQPPADAAGGRAESKSVTARVAFGAAGPPQQAAALMALSATKEEEAVEACSREFQFAQELTERLSRLVVATKVEQQQGDEGPEANWSALAAVGLGAAAAAAGSRPETPSGVHLGVVDTPAPPTAVVAWGAASAAADDDNSSSGGGGGASASALVADGAMLQKAPPLPIPGSANLSEYPARATTTAVAAANGVGAAGTALAVAADATDSLLQAMSMSPKAVPVLGRASSGALSPTRNSSTPRAAEAGGVIADPAACGARMSSLSDCLVEGPAAPAAPAAARDASKATATSPGAPAAGAAAPAAAANAGSRRNSSDGPLLALPALAAAGAAREDSASADEKSESLSTVLLDNPELLREVEEEQPHRGLRGLGALLKQLGRSELPALRRQEMEWVFGLTGAAGSAMYMAPEVHAKQPYNEKADVFSFGVVMYELLAREVLIVSIFNTGRAAKLGVREPPDYAALVATGYRPERPKALGDEAWELLAACWHQDPVQRPGMVEVQSRLAALLLQEQQVAAGVRRRGGGGTAASGGGVGGAPGCGCVIS